MGKVIAIEGLSKKYSLGQRGRYVALRDVISESVSRLAKVGSRAAVERTPEETPFWALKDVSFQVEEGEVIGIIGPNGAGKSTLLKILSRITEPTEGRIEMRGRVASLLEVGTGFHPELTGRENIFLNGAILGMRKSEIKQKFDEIAGFAEVERFLDTPVKHYSSGMYVRLAFSVAAHLEPEILIIDEVLAVGDIEFQRKCLGKMREVGKSGRTILFVSHNMAAIQTLCARAVHLRGGQVVQIGRVDEVVGDYVAQAHSRTSAASARRRIGGGVEVMCCELRPNPASAGAAVNFRIALASDRPSKLWELALLLYSPQGYRLAVLDFRPFGLPAPLTPSSVYQVEGTIHDLPLVEGEYQLGLYVNTGDFAGDVHDLNTVSVWPSQANGDHVPYPAAHRGTIDLGFSVSSAGTTPP